MSWPEIRAGVFAKQTLAFIGFEMSSADVKRILEAPGFSLTFGV
jgi:hypothetical protein